MSSEQWKLTDKKLYRLAEKITDWYAVGLNLDLSANELNCIEVDTCKENPWKRVFDMLYLWREEGYLQFNDNELKAILRDALSAVSSDQTKAIEELNSGANFVQVDADVRGDAVVTHAFNVDDGDVGQA